MKLTKVFFLIAMLSATSAQAAFVNDYDVSKWSQITRGDSSVDTSNAPNSVTLTTSNDGSSKYRGGLFTVAAAKDGLVSFNWDYNSSDSRGTSWDKFGVVLNGVFTLLTDATKKASFSQNGIFSFAVSAGDIFGFSFFSRDSLFGSANIAISDFHAPSAVVPLPAALWLFFAPLAFLFRKKIA